MDGIYVFLVTGISFLVSSIFTLLPQESPTQSSDLITPYRKQSKTSKQDEIYTGYHQNSHRMRNRINTADCAIYQIPLEIQLQIMGHLNHVDLFCLRQSCYMFLSAFEHKSFKKLQRPINIPEDYSASEHELNRTSYIFSEYQYMANHLRRQQENPAGCGEVQRRYQPIVEMNLNRLSGEEKQEVAQRTRLNAVCEVCSKKQAIPSNLFCRRFFYYPEKRLLHCADCKRMHNVSLFSEYQLAKSHPICMGWEGKIQICPHQHMSLLEIFKWMESASAQKGAESRNLSCQACQLHFQPKGQEHFPTLSISNDHNLRLHWTMVVCDLRKGQLVTKDLIRRGLIDVEERFNNEYLCPHLTFSNQELMVPFNWEHCVCFREASPEKPECYRSKIRDHESSQCCACNSSKHADATGILMMPSLARKCGHSLHQVLCRLCHATYRWGVDSNRITFTREHYFVGISMFHQTTHKRQLSLKGREEISRWVRCLDPTTYHGNEHMQQHKGCIDKACSNSLNRRMCLSKEVWLQERMETNFKLEFLRWSVHTVE